MPSYPCSILPIQPHGSISLHWRPLIMMQDYHIPTIHTSWPWQIYPIGTTQSQHNLMVSVMTIFCVLHLTSCVLLVFSCLQNRAVPILRIFCGWRRNICCITTTALVPLQQYRVVNLKKQWEHLEGDMWHKCCGSTVKHPEVPPMPNGTKLVRGGVDTP